MTFSSRLPLTTAASLVFLLAGCSHLRSGPAHDYVYVAAKGNFLRDRVAAVSNRVAEVQNGDRLEVLQHGRRFLQVKTDKGAIGWIEEHEVIDQKLYDQFSALDKQHAHDPVIATGVLRDDSYLHEQPGRKTPHFYLLPENDKLQLLLRASVPKPEVPGALPLPVAKPVSDTTHGQVAPVAAEPPALEDYWLVRDQQGRTGWVRSRGLDVDVPDAIASLAESERMVGAYLLRKVDDPDSNFPGHQAPEYLAVLSPYKDGLPYDFDQIRVFTWNSKKHRYETAYRQHDLQGFLPVTITTQTFGNQQEPVFSFRTSSSPDLGIDAQTGLLKAVPMQPEAFRLEGGIVKRVGDDPTPSAPRKSANRATAVSAPSAHRKHTHRHRRLRG